VLISGGLRVPADIGILVRVPPSDSFMSVRGWYSVPSQVLISSDVRVPSENKLLVKDPTSAGILASIISARTTVTSSIRIPIRNTANIRVL